ncbi:MAG: MBL fold metallo-hydrolase [Chloroflexi bacterium]|nr:MBL fold metallo-hydrolase [Chloroflexota bacterium]
MKIKWLGHASFLITAADGTRIITDPYGDYPGLSYAPIGETADVIIVSHDHGDHVGGRVKGNPKQVAGAGSRKIGTIEFKGINAYHDTSKGNQRGKNTIFCFTADGVRICHLGDLGHALSKSEIDEIGQVDVLMIPVGGFYTIDAATAGAICEHIKPKLVLPMHYKNDKCAFPIAGIDDFIRGKKNVKRPDSAEMELKAGQLPQATEIVVLKHAL